MRRFRQYSLIAEFEDDSNLVMVTRQGVIKKTEMSAFSRIRQNGLIAIAIREGDQLISVLRTHGDDNIIIGSRRHGHRIPRERCAGHGPCGGGRAGH